MEKDLNQLLQKAIKASDKANADLAAAQEAFDNTEDQKARDKAEKALNTAREVAEAKAKEKAAAQEAFDNAPPVESDTLTGSEDSNYTFHAKDKNAWHIKHSRIETLTSGVPVEDPGSIRIQMYDKHTFEDQKLNAEKGMPSIWDMGETLKVLHDPTK